MLTNIRSAYRSKTPQEFTVSVKTAEAIDALVQSAIHVTQLAEEAQTAGIAEAEAAVIDAYEAFCQRRRELYERVVMLEVPHNIHVVTRRTV